jgi:hypothetical protein
MMRRLMDRKLGAKGHFRKETWTDVYIAPLE